MASKINSIEKIKECIKINKSFVLQGGAGSGKTESLKKILEHVSNDLDSKRSICITHTNLAVEEIQKRVVLNENITICTIHSFLNSLVKDYKKNIHSVIFELFKIPLVERGKDDGSAEFKKEEHENFKEIYKKYSARAFAVSKITTDKVVGKKEYDKSPETFNDDLNGKITKLNMLMQEEINRADYRKIEYNETSFNSYQKLSYGHDGLIKISYLLFKKYSVLGKITQDKYDFVFIDEYQDTHQDVIEIFLNLLPRKNATVVGLFGDSMQSIYDDGVGDVEEYVAAKKLIKIEKNDNYRCSKSTIDLINRLRTDGLVQEMEFKINEHQEVEDERDRHGKLKMYYSVCAKKPTVFSPQEEKDAYLGSLDRLIGVVSKELTCFKTLMLTNSSISKKLNFENLYNVFSDMYIDPKEYIDQTLERLHVLDLCRIIVNYRNKKYNSIYSSLVHSGFLLNKVEDKIKLKEIIEEILNSDLSMLETLEKAFSYKLITKSESYLGYLNTRESFLKKQSSDKEHISFKSDFNNGNHTYAKMAKIRPEIDEETFNEKKRDVEREVFFNDLFSNKIKFQEVLKYYDYICEETDFITMHKTKGSGISNVLVVLDEYFWNKYNFGSIFQEVIDESKKKNLRLVYVACSRAIHDLVCVRLISEEEKPLLLKYFPEATELEI